jgi:hypothetical protein
MTRDQTRKEGPGAKEETKSTENCQAAGRPPQATRCRLKNSWLSLLKNGSVGGKPEAGSFQLVAGSLAVLSCSLLDALDLRLDLYGFGRRRHDVRYDEMISTSRG